MFKIRKEQKDAFTAAFGTMAAPCTWCLVLRIVEIKGLFKPGHDDRVNPRPGTTKGAGVTRTDLTHHAFASLWTRYALADGGPYQMKSAEPLVVQLQSDATAARAVVTGHRVTAPGGPTGTEKSAREEAPMPPGPGATQQTSPEWLRAVVDSLHDGLVKASFDAVFSILASIPHDPPEPPRPALPEPTAEKTAYQAALDGLAQEGITDPPYEEDPNQP